MSFAQRIRTGGEASRNSRAAILLDLEVRDHTVLDYLAKFKEEDRPERALDALKMGVIALRSAGPTLDAEVVARQLERLIGPGSDFARALDPTNQKGVIALIEARVQELLEGKLKAVLGEFSLDRRGSALARLKTMLSDLFQDLRHALGVEEGRKGAAERSPAKGLDFQAALYRRVAQWAQQLGDEIECVADTPGANGRKTGDYVIALGDATGAQGLRIVIEAKNQRYPLKQARAELQRAKKTREAACGIFAFAKGCEPAEVGDFHRAGEDIYCTIDRDLLDTGNDLLFLEAAYKIVRVQAVARVRKEATGRLDLQRIGDHIDHLTGSVKVIGDLAAKARAVKNNSVAIENTLRQVKDDLEGRLNKMHELLNVQPMA
jgi:hypothetical protein